MKSRHMQGYTQRKRTFTHTFYTIIIITTRLLWILHPLIGHEVDGSSASEKEKERKKEKGFSNFKTIICASGLFIQARHFPRCD